MLQPRITVLIALLVVASALPVPAGAQEKTAVTVRIAKTQAAVLPFGSVSGAGADARVVVRLAKERKEGYELLATRRAPVAEDGSFRVRIDRPQRGRCRVRARVEGTQSRDEEFFPCFIPDFPRGRATLTDLTTSVEIDALIAETDAHRQYGLMYRPKLPFDLGMAFLFESDTRGGFWMKNTLIPLSIAFFDSGGVIVRIMDMEPCVEDPCEVYDPGVSYRGALEVNQGSFEEWGISEGDTITIEEGP